MYQDNLVKKGFLLKLGFDQNTIEKLDEEHGKVGNGRKVLFVFEEQIEFLVA